MDDRLRVDDDLDLFEGDVEEQVRFDDFQPFVDQGRGVEGDDRAHAPRGVGERLLWGDVGELGGGAAAERSAAGGDDEAAHVVAAGGEVALRQAGELVGGQAGEALGDRVVLGVHGHDLSGDGELPDERAADDQRFFVGKGKITACFKGCD